MFLRYLPTASSLPKRELVKSRVLHAYRMNQGSQRNANHSVIISTRKKEKCTEYTCQAVKVKLDKKSDRSTYVHICTEANLSVISSARRHACLYSMSIPAACPASPEGEYDINNIPDHGCSGLTCHTIVYSTVVEGADLDIYMRVVVSGRLPACVCIFPRYYRYVEMDR